MSTTIDELMVSLGVNVQTQSFRNANSAFAQLESRALQMGRSLGGPAVAGAIMGVGTSYAKTTAQLGRFAREAGVSANMVNGLQFALEQSGGSAEDARASIGGVLDLWRDFQVGDTSKLDAAAMLGFDSADVLRAQSVEQAMSSIAKQTSQMSPEKRRNVLSALGLGDNVGVRTLFGEGAGQLQEYLKTAKELAPVTDDMVDASIDATQALGEMSLAMRGFRDQMSMSILPDLTEAMREITGIMGMARESSDDDGSAWSWVKRAWNAPDDLVEFILKEREQIDAEGLGAWWDEVKANGDARRNDDFGRGVYIRPSASLDPVDDNLLKALAIQESGNRHRDANGNLITSHAGALGKYQIMPATAKDPGYGVTPLRNDSEGEHKRFADDYLTALVDKYGGDTGKALAAYNAGPGSVDKAIKNHGANWLSALPAETRAYVPSVTSKLSKLEGGRPQASMNGPITFNINGATDVDAVGREVERRIGIMARQAGDDMASGVV